MIIRFIGSLLFITLTILGFFFVNLWALIVTLLWNHRAFKQYWPEWGIKDFGKSLYSAATEPWRVR